MPLYRIRVRSKTYLWGGSKIDKDLSFDVIPVFLTIRNDDFGDAISVTIERHALSGEITEEKIGILEGAQAYTLHLDKVRGVYAVQDRGRPTLVTCEIHGR
jgi:hypothetical protein